MGFAWVPRDAMIPWIVNLWLPLTTIFVPGWMMRVYEGRTVRSPITLCVESVSIVPFTLPAARLVLRMALAGNWTPVLAELEFLLHAANSRPAETKRLATLIPVTGSLVLLFISFLFFYEKVGFVNKRTGRPRCRWPDKYFSAPGHSGYIVGRECSGGC